MKKIVLRKDLCSLFSYMVAILLFFMFRNRDSYFNINNYRNGLILIVLVGCFILVLNWIKHGFKFTTSKLAIFGACLCLLNSKYVLGKSAEPYYILFIIILLIFLLCMAEMNFDIRNVRFIINSYILSSVVMSIVLILQHRTPYAQYNIFRWALFFDSEKYYDVNFTAMYLLIPTLLAFYGAIKGKKKKRFVYMLATIINMVSILMLGSRGTFAPVIAIMAFLILRDRKISVTKISIIVIVLFAIFFLLPEDIFSRLIETDYFNTESKRYMDWAYGMKVFSNSPIWGAGMRAPKILVEEVGGGVLNYTIHSTYIVYLAQLGIIGTIPFGIILFWPLITFLRKKVDLYLILSYCGILFTSLMIEANYSYVLFIPLSIVYMIMRVLYVYQLDGKCIMLVLFDEDYKYGRTKV